MTRKEFRKLIKHELYGDKKISALNKIRIKYFQPNTNCMYLARKMWFYHNEKKFKLLAKLLYKKIFRKYGCCIYPSAIVGKGFFIAHPVAITIGRCVIGDNFAIYQNCIIGARHVGDERKGNYPIIGNNVRLFSGSSILGAVSICDNVTIGAHSLVIKNINQPGIYVGCPVKWIKEI